MCRDHDIIIVHERRQAHQFLISPTHLQITTPINACMECMCIHTCTLMDCTYSTRSTAFFSASSPRGIAGVSTLMQRKSHHRGQQQIKPEIKLGANLTIVDAQRAIPPAWTRDRWVLPGLRGGSWLNFCSILASSAQCLFLAQPPIGWRGH